MVLFRRNSGRVVLEQDPAGADSVIQLSDIEHDCDKIFFCIENDGFGFTIKYFEVFRNL